MYKEQPLFISYLNKSDNVEQLFVHVKYNNNENFVIGTCYIPPSSATNIYTNHVESLESILSPVYASATFIIVGDYNLWNVFFPER